MGHSLITDEEVSRLQYSVSGGMEIESRNFNLCSGAKLLGKACVGSKFESWSNVSGMFRSSVGISRYRTPMVGWKIKQNSESGSQETELK